MTNGLFQHITVEVSISIQWVKITGYGLVTAADFLLIRL